LYEHCNAQTGLLRDILECLCSIFLFVNVAMYRGARCCCTIFFVVLWNHL